MKRMLQTVAIAALVVVLIGVSGYMIQTGQAQTPTQDAPNRTVTVSGSGRVSAAPDTAIINIGVETQAETAETALADNNERMSALIETLKENGVEADNIQTTSINLQAQYEEEPRINSDGRRLAGYRAQNMVEVRVTDLDNLGEVLDAAMQAGGNQIHGIRFEVSDSADLQDEARAAAVENARDKAEQLASLTDSDLGQVVTINETSRTPGPVVRAESFGAADAAAVPVEAGTQTVEIQVEVTWQLQ